MSGREEDVTQRFVPRSTGRSQQAAMSSVRDAFINLVRVISANVAEGRERSLVYTKLEEAAFFANASISRETPPVVSSVPDYWVQAYEAGSGKSLLDAIYGAPKPTKCAKPNCPHPSERNYWEHSGDGVERCIKQSSESPSLYNGAGCSHHNFATGEPMIPKRPSYRDYISGVSQARGRCDETVCDLGRDGHGMRGCYHHEGAISSSKVR